MSDAVTTQQLADLTAAGSDRDGLEIPPKREGRRPRRVRALDFSRPIKLSPAEHTRFEAAHSNFCRDASIRLSSELHSTIELEVTTLTQLTWAAAMQTAPAPVVFATAVTAPSPGRILIAIEEMLLVRMIERLLGGGHDEPPVGRMLTEIDVAVARRVFATLTESLSEAWQELLGLSLTLADIEPQHANVDLVPASEPTLALTVQARDATSAATIALLVPYASIASAGGSLYGHADDEGAERDGSATGMMRTAVGSVDVELRAEVAAIELTLGEVLALGVGDMVRLGPVGREAVFGGDTCLHRAKPGRSGNRRAVQIVERLDGTL